MAKKQQHPKEWNARPVDVKSGWKNNSKVLAEITSAVNCDKYVPNEDDFMEYMDLALEFIKEKYFSGSEKV